MIWKIIQNWEGRNEEWREISIIMFLKLFLWHQFPFINKKCHMCTHTHNLECLKSNMHKFFLMYRRYHRLFFFFWLLLVFYCYSLFPRYRFVGIWISPLLPFLPPHFSLPVFPPIFPLSNGYKLHMLLFECIMALQVQEKVENLISYGPDILSWFIEVLLLFGIRDAYWNKTSIPGMPVSITYITQVTRRQNL